MSTPEALQAMDMALIATTVEFAAIERTASTQLARRFTVDTFDELIDENLFYQIEHEVFGGLFDITNNDDAFIQSVFDFIDDKATNAAWFSAFYNRNIPPEFLTKALPVVSALFREGYATYTEQRSRVDDLLNPPSSVSPTLLTLAERFAESSEFAIGNRFEDLLGRTTSALRTGILLYVLWVSFAGFAWLALNRVAQAGCPEAGAGVVGLFATTFEAIGRPVLLAAGDEDAATALTAAAIAARAGAQAMQCSTAATGSAKAAQLMFSNGHIQELAIWYSFGIGTPFSFVTNWWSNPLSAQPGIEKRDRGRLDRFRRARETGGKKKKGRVEELNARLIGCDICASPALHTCDDCGDAYYCSKKCQIIGWREGGHADECCAL